MKRKRSAILHKRLVVQRKRTAIKNEEVVGSSSLK